MATLLAPIPASAYHADTRRSARRAGTLWKLCHNRNYKPAVWPGVGPALITMRCAAEEHGAGTFAVWAGLGRRLPVDRGLFGQLQSLRFRLKFQDRFFCYLRSFGLPECREYSLGDRLQPSEHS